VFTNVKGDAFILVHKSEDFTQKLVWEIHIFNASRARITKQGKLAWESNFPSGKFCAVSYRHSRILSIMTNTIYHEQRKLASGLRHVYFWVLNNGAKNSKLKSTNLCKSPCMIHSNTLLTSIAIKSPAKNNCPCLFQLKFFTACL